MTQEQKELLLKDLCARLPYGVIIEHEENLSKLDTIFMCDSISISSTSMDKELSYNLDLDEVKPYLFPLSSMTEEQKQYLKNRFCYDWDGEPYDLWKYQIEIGEADELIDWFHKNHLDYRNLIPMGLAIDATELNIY